MSIYHGASDAVAVKPGTLVRRITSEGTSYALTLNGTADGVNGYTIVRGDELSTVDASFGVPAGFYVDEITARKVLEGPTPEEDAYEMDLVCRQPSNMGDGVVTSSIPDVFQLRWQQMDIPLAAHSVRYTTLKQFVGTSNKTVWGYIQDWIQASNVAEQEAAYKVIAADGTADQIIDFEDYCVMHTRGVESVERFLPILIRTQVTNTAPTSPATPGQIETPPTGFGSMKPTGFTWRRMPDEVTRTGRSGAYNVVSQWVGDPQWDTRLYGTLAQQADNYQNLG